MGKDRRVVPHSDPPGSGQTSLYVPAGGSSHAAMRVTGEANVPKFCPLLVRSVQPVGCALRAPKSKIALNKNSCCAIVMGPVDGKAVVPVFCSVWSGAVIPDTVIKLALLTVASVGLLIEQVTTSVPLAGSGATIVAFQSWKKLKVKGCCRGARAAQVSPLPSAHP